MYYLGTDMSKLGFSILHPTPVRYRVPFLTEHLELLKLENNGTLHVPYRTSLVVLPSEVASAEKNSVIFRFFGSGMSALS